MKEKQSRFQITNIVTSSCLTQQAIVEPDIIKMGVKKYLLIVSYTYILDPKLSNKSSLLELNIGSTNKVHFKSN